MNDPAAITAIPECLDCGACCHTANAGLIELLGADAVAVPGNYVTREANGALHMRMVQNAQHQCWVCSALGEKNICQIYMQRPFVCREFERGSPECLQAIADLRGDSKRRVH